MDSIVIVIISVLFLTIGYAFYGRFIAKKVLMLNEKNTVPSVILKDGQDFVPTNKVVLMGHHFAAIAGAGPLILFYSLISERIWMFIEFNMFD